MQYSASIYIDGFGKLDTAAYKMAYPFIQLPNWGDLLRMAQTKFGVQIKTVQGTSDHYLLRETEKEKYLASIPKLGLGDRLQFEVIRSLCNQLDIPEKEFGVEIP